MISVVINTCALGPAAAVTRSSDGRTGAFHDGRAYALRNFIIPSLTRNPFVRELIVVGEWEPGPGYTYEHVPSVFRSSADALAQRQRGFELATGSLLMFQHDDHMLDGMWWLGMDSRADVLVPARFTRLRDARGEPLNNGAPDYISGHCAVYKRAVLERCPWGAVPKVRTWDMAHTRQIRDAGFGITFSDAFRVYDVEQGSTPWL